MPKTVVITQSNYLPWRGYFDLLDSADDVILLDCVQFTRRDWRNRNFIKTSIGKRWLTIPLQQSGHRLSAIDEMRVVDSDWSDRHIASIRSAYSGAAHFDKVAPWLFELLRIAAKELFLTHINEKLLREICGVLGITVPIRRCRDVFDREALLHMGSTERLISLSKAVHATRYLSGPRGRDYLDTDRFRAEGIELAWMTYDMYPEYPQLWGSFEPLVSVIDLLLNTGPDAPRYLQRQHSKRIGSRASSGKYCV